MKKARMLIVSTYNTQCGIASFTSVLDSQLSNDVEISIAQLDQDILRRFPKSFGDNAIREIIQMSKSFDVVNIQLEWGILGSTPAQITKRFKWLLEGCDNIILTVHTPITTFSTKRLVSYLSKLRILAAIKLFVTSFYGMQRLRIIKNAVKRLNDRFHIVVHTKRERKFFESLHGLKNVHDHPLSHLQTDWLARLTTDGVKYRRSLKERFGEDAKIVACFGFISPYKGLETAISAMELLPENYKLLIYGSIHPEAIQSGVNIDTYLARLLKKLGYRVQEPVDRKYFPITAKKESQENKILSKINNVFFMGSPHGNLRQK
jgi:glycosyltransferase involved in cell wall biosynthesis